MSATFLIGSVQVAGQSCPTAHVTCDKAPVAVLDGSFVCMALKPGSYVFTAHAPGHSVVRKKVAVPKLTGKAKSVVLRIKPVRA